MTDDLRTKLARQARSWLDAPCIFLDTETTGLEGAEVVEISIIDAGGKVLMDTLVRPTRPIPSDATRIHGITDADVRHAPRWSDIHEKFSKIVEGRTVVIYNSEYDEKVIWQTNDLYELRFPDFKSECAMAMFAKFYAGKNNARWQKLGFAADFCEVQIDGAAHRALVDCQMTRGVVEHIARYEK